MNLDKKQKRERRMGQVLASVVLIRTVCVFLECKPVKLSVVVNRVN